jgi:diguanylate cyclase (GGDEF)-like protein/PAS domain S-box-containing protein
MPAALITPSDYQLIFEASPYPCLVLRPDAAFTVIAVSDRYLAATATRPEHLLGLSLFAIFANHPEDSGGSGGNELRASLERVMRDRAADRMGAHEYGPVRGGIEGVGMKHCNVVNTPVFGEQGTIAFIIHNVEEVCDFALARRHVQDRHVQDEGAEHTEKVEARAEHADTELAGRAKINSPAEAATAESQRTERMQRQAAAVFATTNEAIMITDSEGNIVAVNKAFTRISGFESDEVVGRNPKLQQSGRHDERFYQNMWRDLETGGQWQGEIWNQRKNGEIYPAWENISVVKDEQGRIINYVSIFSDIGVIKQAEERMSRLAHHDALTDLPNRLLFMAHLHQALEREKRHGHKIALLLLDLDRFKLINDTLGHAVGDRLLQVVAQRLKCCVRAEDTVARLGGDEFIVLLNEMGNAQDAALVALKIRDELAKPIMLDGKQVVTAASIGISVYPTDAQNTEDLVKAADAAMYRAKERGRHTFEFYTVELTAKAQERLSLEVELRQALANREFVLYYQPQLELATGRIVGVEALLRWRHPSKGLVLPDNFIPIAEETGLIEPIGEWVINAAFAQAAAWSALSVGPVRVAVNLSGRQMLYDHVFETVDRALRAHQVAPHHLQVEIEITESVLLSLERSADILGRLRTLGVSIAIDDFGTGYSSLSHLKHLPIDTLKIAQVFVRHIPGDADDKAIASAIIAVGHNLRMRVIAEGVETREQLEFLRAQGCDEVQGHVICKAIRVEEITDVLRADHARVMEQDVSGQAVASARNRR